MSNNQTPFCESLQPGLMAYALGEAEADGELTAHIATCESCQRDMEAYYKVARVLPYSAPSVAPPPKLRSRILAAAAAQKTSRATGPRQLVQLLGRFRPSMRLAFTGACVAVALLLGWNIALQSRLNAGAAQLARSRESWQTMTRLLNDPTVRSVALTGDQARGHIWVANNDDLGCLVVEGLPEPGADMVYQVWLRAGDRPVGVATFEARNGNAWAFIRAQQPIAQFDAIGITIEPRGGSSAPTGKRVLFGTLDALGMGQPAPVVSGAP